MTSLPDILLFTEPASNWENRLPLGNGRLGVMLGGNPCKESLQLNEENIWSGGPMDRTNPATIEGIEKVRTLMNQNKIAEAQEMAYRTMSGNPVGMRVYQTAGDFNVEFFSKKNFGVPGPMESHIPENYSDYKMTLDMSKAVATVTYKDDEGTTFTRTTFVSAVDDVIVMRVQADKKGKINFRCDLNRGLWCDRVFSDGDEIFLEDSHGVPFCVGATAICIGGTKEVSGMCICGEDVDEVIFLIAIKTLDRKFIRGKDKVRNLDEYRKVIEKNTWNEGCKRQLDKFSNLAIGAFEKIYNAHVEEYKSWYDRMTFRLGTTQANTETPATNPNTQADGCSTPSLLNSLKESYNTYPNGGAAPCSESKINCNALLLQQYANFGRYLLISSSRAPGEMPANLQGIWNCYMDPPWGSKYTININAQMNYWAANICNLSETEIALFDLLEQGYQNGVYTAKKMYGCNGYVMHHNTDIWGDAAPQDAWVPGTYWTLGNGWLATHIWEHYEYTLDRVCLARYYYLMHEACVFYSEFLQPSEFNAPDGKPYLILNPSASPENTYRTKDGVTGVFSKGCEMDNQILTHLFSTTLKAMEVLGNDAKDANGKKYDGADKETFEYVLAHIKKPSLNSDGSIMEWNEEFEEPEPGHRHISHLYGLYPGKSISVDETPELAKAANKTLEKRLSGGGGHTGWSQAWIINFRAALRQGKLAGDAVSKILSHSTNPNLLDIHPPFQIDGNFGSLAGIMRMLVQSDLKWNAPNGQSPDQPQTACPDGKINPTVIIHLLPALPDTPEWQSGSIRGVRLRGGLFIDMKWQNGKVTDYKVYGSNSKHEVAK